MSMSPRDLGRVHGAEAHQMGKPCIPALDLRARVYIQAVSDSDGEVLAYLQGWQSGWVQASLGTGLSGDTCATVRPVID